MVAEPCAEARLLALGLEEKLWILYMRGHWLVCQSMSGLMGDRATRSRVCEGLHVGKVMSSNFTHSLNFSKVSLPYVTPKSTFVSCSLLDIQYGANYLSFKV